MLDSLGLLSWLFFLGLLVGLVVGLMVEWLSLFLGGVMWVCSFSGKIVPPWATYFFCRRILHAIVSLCFKYCHFRLRVIVPISIYFLGFVKVVVL